MQVKDVEQEIVGAVTEMTSKTMSSKWTVEWCGKSTNVNVNYTNDKEWYM